jgi:molecular chaperone DnaK
MRADYQRDFSTDPKIVGRLRLEAERVKINLCNQDAGQEFFLANVAPEVDEINYSLGPAEFKKMLRPILERTRQQVDVAMDSAAKRHSLSWDDVDAFVLVGGSSKMPYVKQLLEEVYKKPVKSDLNPDEIVSIGAARLAVDYPPSQGVDIHGEEEIKIDKSAPVPQGLVDTQIKDVVSHTLGIGLKGDVYDALIEKDKYIPHKVNRKGYTTAEDNQTSIYIPVYQGDNPKASLNYQLGEVVISDLTPSPVGTHRFEVTFALDQDGVFFGEILHQQTGQKKEIKLQRGQGALVEKRRVDLADALDKGNVTVADTGAPTGAGQPQPAGGDRVNDLIDQAQKILDALPANEQTELSDALVQLAMAKANNNPREQTNAVLRITSVLNRHRAG